MAMMTTRDRYLTDPVFHRLVDFVRQGIRENQYTPGEVREAAILAAYLEECENPHPRWWHIVERELSELDKSRNAP